MGLTAAVPRAPSSWTAVGANTLSVYVLHLYVLPAVDFPLAALTQAAGFFVHPEAATLVAILGCLLVIRGLAMPLPALPARAPLRAAVAAGTWLRRRAGSACGRWAGRGVLG